MSGTDLLEREQQAGNEADNLNPGDRAYHNQVDGSHEAIEGHDRSSDGFDDIVNQPDFGHRGSTHVDSHGDTVQNNLNSDPDPDENIAKTRDKEENPDNLYNESGVGEKSSNSQSRMDRAKGLFKKIGPSVGVGGLGVGLLIGGSALTGSAALFIAIERSVSSDGADSTRTNIMMRRSFMGNLLGKGPCTGVAIKCRLTAMGKESLQKWKDQGFKVKGTVTGADGKSIAGGQSKELITTDLDGDKLARVESLTFPDGEEVKNGEEYTKKINSNADANRVANRVVNMRSAFFMNSKFNKVLSKFGIKKGAVEEKDSKTSRENAEKVVTDERNKLEGKLRSVAAKSGLVSSPISIACLGYNTSRIIVGSVKAIWVSDIVAFAIPFMQLGSKMIDQGDLTEADKKLLEKKAGDLTWYANDKQTEKLAAQESDPVKKAEIIAKKDLTATDSQGLRASMYGDTTELLSFTEKYTTGGITSIATLSSIIGMVQNAIPGGKDAIRAACITAARAGLAESVVFIGACIAGSVLTFGLAAAACTAKEAAQIAAILAAAYVITKVATDAAIEALKSSDINKDLKGVDAGNALAAGIGLYLARNSQGAGLKPATSTDQVKKFITATDNEYIKDTEELARYEAKDTPFDINNRYSFVGSLASSLSIYNEGTKTGFGQLANLFSVFTKPLSMLGTTSASALLYQPSLMTTSDENLMSRLNNGECKDSEKYEAGFVCDRTSGRTVNVTSDRVLLWAKEDSEGKYNGAKAQPDQSHIYDTIDFMTSDHPGNNEGLDEGTGTRDETCGSSLNFFEGVVGDGCEDSEKASIDENGVVQEDSQYSKYKKYCTENRELQPGSTDEMLETGSQKDQDWASMKQCAKDSLMMDHFAYYYNFCETQFSTSEDFVDDVNGCAKNSTPQKTIVADGPWACPVNVGKGGVMTQGPHDIGAGTSSGVDYAYSGNLKGPGADILAVRDGTVTTVGPASGYGTWVIISHTENGKSIDSYYGHMDGIGNVNVTVGQTVKAGELIANAGNSGFSTGPHVHVGLRFNDGGSPTAQDYETRFMAAC